MTMLEFLQTHTFEEILENDEILNTICFELNLLPTNEIVYIRSYDNEYIDFKSFCEYHFSSICKKYGCKYFEDNDYDDLLEMYDICNYNMNNFILDKNLGIYTKRIEKEDFSCPYENEHKELRAVYAKKLLLKELAE